MTPSAKEVLALIRLAETLSIIPLAVLLARRPRLPTHFRPLVPYLLGDVLLCVLDAYARRVLHHNSFVFHLSTLSDVSWLLLIFGLLTPAHRRKRLFCLWLGFLGSAVVSAGWTDGFWTEINTLSRITGNLLLVTLALRQLGHMANRPHLPLPERNPELVLSLMVLAYYSCATISLLSQTLYRYPWLGKLGEASQEFSIMSASAYPFLRLLQLALLLHFIGLFPLGVHPRQALPRWLRFRVGWRRSSQSPPHRVLPDYLIR